MFQPLLEAIDALMASLLAASPVTPLPTSLGPPITNWTDVDAYLPSVRTAKVQLDGLSEADRQQVLKDRLSTVKAKRDWIEAQLTASKFPLLATPQTLVNRLSTAPSYSSPLAAVTSKQLDHRLRHNRGPTATASDPEQMATGRAFNALMALDGAVPPQPVDLASIARTSLSTAEVLLEMRCLEDIYLRFGVAVEAATRARSTPARALALHRQEGDLNVPYSIGSIFGLDLPEYGSGANKTRIHYPPGRSTARYSLSPAPYMHNIVPIYDTRKSISTDTQAKADAEECFDLLLVGFDILHNHLFREVEFGSPISSEDWLALNRRAVEPGLSPAQALKAVTDDRAQRKALLEVTGELNKPVATATCLVVAPNNPYEYTTGILAEALRYLERLTPASVLVPGAAGNLPEILAYLRYHQGPDKSRGCIASAIARARGSAKASAVALAKLVKDNAPSDMNTVLNTVQSLGSDPSIVYAVSVWGSHFLPVLIKPGALDVLAKWLRAADLTDWPSWTEVRQNVQLYDRLHGFYGHLIS